MLPKNRRIPTPLLLKALKKSRLSSSEHLILRVHNLPAIEQNEPARLAIITPAKINKRAVDRHLSKRKISACLENNLNLIKPGQLLIWQVKQDIVSLESAALAWEIKSLI